MEREGPIRRFLRGQEEAKKHWIVIVDIVAKDNGEAIRKVNSALDRAKLEDPAKAINVYGKDYWDRLPQPPNWVWREGV